MKKTFLSATQQDIVRRLQGVAYPCVKAHLRVTPDYTRRTTLYEVCYYPPHHHLGIRASSASIRALMRKGVLVQSMPGHRLICELTEDWKV